MMPSPLPAGADSLLHRMDGRVKTVVLLAAVVLASGLRHSGLALGLWLGAAAVFLLAGMHARQLLKRLLMPLGIAWVVLLSVLFTHGHHPWFSVTLGHVTLTAWREGAWQGGLLFCRIMAAVTLAALLAMSTPMIEILETLRLCKVPGVIIDIADMMYRYMFIIEDTAQTMRRARQSRLGDDAPWVQRVGDVGRIACSIMVRSLDRSTRIYQAMLARGHHEHARDLPFFSHPISARDRLAGLLSVLGLAALAAANLWLA
ncbi:MAG: cobalt ECF transporter T component CbiQ [Paludibacterium sp.]|uniref:cobalt ECF transporter T component CbiQ n=1 Tax=Paludibacterium sp. TaxID=1917523 RepID=UPI0025E42D1E|nr:cobalt ECF transporter T component CbiQ [Paludibacterium sp.]MBV8045765.1 cobalt ECF transporter T component CbiQ [Paludibacterium sp.]MBV8649245.1 cobalt ECF transporter T component CbiQ [Paludibacterium sp.]